MPSRNAAVGKGDKWEKNSSPFKKRVDWVYSQKKSNQKQLSLSSNLKRKKKIVVFYPQAFSKMIKKTLFYRIK